MGEGCVFCEIIAGRAPGLNITRWPDAVTIAPLNPVTRGHMLVVPRTHVRDALENSLITGQVMRRAAQYADFPCNIITSVGAVATQTVMHFHVHVVPRRKGDGLALPWDIADNAAQVRARVDATVRVHEGKYTPGSVRSPLDCQETYDLLDEMDRLRKALHRIQHLDPYGDWPDDDAVITAQSIAAAALDPS